MATTRGPFVLKRPMGVVIVLTALIAQGRMTTCRWRSSTSCPVRTPARSLSTR